MGRTPCCEKNGLKKGPWTPEEDQKLIDYIQKHGYGNWRTLPKNAGLQRCGKSCRLRWTNYLRPDIKRGRFSFEEEETIIQLHSILGNKWSAIASRLPGRTDNEIKNYWNTHIRKRLLSMGIDPVTHSPRLDLLDLSSILSSSLCGSSPQMLGMQHPLQLNPGELLKLASSLFSSHQHQHHHYDEDPHINNAQHDHEINHLCNPQIQNQITHFCQTQDHSAQEAAFNQAQWVESNISDSSYPFDSQQQSHTNGFANYTTLTEDYVTPQLPYYYHNNYYGSVTSTFYSNNSNQNLSNFASVLSTPSSSPTPLNSNSTHITDPDERESYVSSSSNIMLKFEIPDMLDIVNDQFM